MAHNDDFLREALKHTIKVPNYLCQHIGDILRRVIHILQVDEFTGKLWEIYETIKSEGGPVQVISF